MEGGLYWGEQAVQVDVPIVDSRRFLSGEAAKEGLQLARCLSDQSFYERAVAEPFVDSEAVWTSVAMCLLRNKLT